MPDDFLVFYGEYPRKEARKKALAAYGRLSVSDRLLALEGVRRAKASVWAGKDLEYVPLPASYLNGRRWEDEARTNGSKPEARMMTDEEKMAAAIERAKRGVPRWVK